MTLFLNIMSLDQDLFLYLNSLHNSFGDHFFWMYTDTLIWLPLYASILYVIIKQQGQKSWITILFIILMVVLCDQISSQIFKDGFQRLRPSQNPLLEGLVHLVNGRKGGLYGFVSSHATNSFGLAMFSSLLFRYKPLTIVIFIWALINSYSRIYLGLHYPGDILGGGLLGIGVAVLVYQIYLRTYNKIELSKRPIIELKKLISQKFNSADKKLIIFVFTTMMITLLIVAKLMVRLHG